MAYEGKDKNKIINIVAIVLTIAIVTGVGAIFISRHKQNEENNIKKEESVTSFSIIGNADSENSDIPTQVVTNQGSEAQTNEVVTNKDGNTVTNKKPDNTTQKTTKYQHNISVVAPNNQSTQKVDESTPVNQDTAKQQAGAFGFTWDPNSGVFYSTSDPWQRQFGYNKYYDVFGGYVALWYDTVRIKFNYGGYDWLVQFWKGQYGFLLLGAEAGVYYKEEGLDTSQYICSDNNMRLKIGYTCYNKGDVLFTRDYQDTWWLTGFVPGKLDKYSDRSQMKMKIRITLKDAAMKDAFVEAIQQPGVGFSQGNASSADTFYTSGNDVYLMWQSDRSKTS
ncbi:MAG: DUF4474 domain-containing protein [Clostridia bacterium]|nr:DUF4474 domain-containing protein [Clostridia bacterium]